MFPNATTTNHTPNPFARLIDGAARWCAIALLVATQPALAQTQVAGAAGSAAPSATGASSSRPVDSTTPANANTAPQLGTPQPPPPIPTQTAPLPPAGPPPTPPLPPGEEPLTPPAAPPTSFDLPTAQNESPLPPPTLPSQPTGLSDLSPPFTDTSGPGRGFDDPTALWDQAAGAADSAARDAAAALDGTGSAAGFGGLGGAGFAGGDSRLDSLVRELGEHIRARDSQLRPASAWAPVNDGNPPMNEGWRDGTPLPELPQAAPVDPPPGP